MSACIVETEWDKNRDGAIVRAVDGPRRLELRISCEKGKAPRLDVQQLGGRDVMTFGVDEWRAVETAIEVVLMNLNIRCVCGHRFRMHAEADPSCNGCCEGCKGFRAETASMVWR